MYAKTISYRVLNDAIRIAFSGDEKIISLYDPNKEVHSIEEIIPDIFRKIKDYDTNGELHLKGVYEKNELIGYFVYMGDMLISFSINIKYRTRASLRKFYSLIKENIRSRFICSLWSKNIRAIKWLSKNGMQIINSNNNITQLICQ